MVFLYKIGFLVINWIDVAEVLLLTFLFYQLYKLMRGTVALKIFFGSVSIYVAYLLFKTLEMQLLTAIFSRIIGVGVIALIVLFQPEIRRFLLMIGRNTFLDNTFSFKFFRSKSVQYDISPIVEAIKNMSATNTGSLIVFTRTSDLRYYIETGEVLDATISRKLLISIFNKYSPLHDGAVIVSDGKIKAARCILPVSESDDLPTQLGLRHRSAMGITEHSDSLVIVTSEETGNISIADYGQLFYNIPPNELHAQISKMLFPPSPSILKQSAKFKPSFQYS
jgi:diadenylate cyclase